MAEAYREAGRDARSDSLTHALQRRAVVATAVAIAALVGTGHRAIATTPGAHHPMREESCDWHHERAPGAIAVIEIERLVSGAEYRWYELIARWRLG